MIRILCLAALLAVAGCSGDSKYPSPNGKGSVRAINAIKGSPDVAFRIEERLLEAIAYKQDSGSDRYDDFEYNFNFDVAYPGDSTAQRIASVVEKVEVDRETTFILTGDIAAPDIDIVEADIREWGASETVFEARFAHLAASLGELDFYIDDAAVPPTAGAAVATLVYGEVMPAMEIPAADYVISITTGGDPGDIVYQSSSISYPAANSYIVPIFDGDETDVAPYTVRLLGATGSATTLADARFRSTVRFMQASYDLPVADIYDDEMLSSRIVSSHAFGDIEAEQPINTSDGFYYTPAGNTGAVLFDFEFASALPLGSHYNFIVYGDDSDRQASFYTPDRRAFSTAARIQVFNAALNHPDGVDFYLLDGTEPLADATRRFSLGYPGQSAVVNYEAGDYEIYVTPFNDKTVLDGPVTVSLELGDMLEILLLDTTDPSTLEISLVPAP